MITTINQYKKLLIKENLVNVNTETEKDVEKDVDKKNKTFLLIDLIGFIK